MFLIYEIFIQNNAEFLITNPLKLSLWHWAQCYQKRRVNFVTHCSKLVCFINEYLKTHCSIVNVFAPLSRVACTITFYDRKIVIYDRNDSTIIIYDHNDSCQYYKNIYYNPIVLIYDPILIIINKWCDNLECALRS